jgi:transcriptional regulator with XRE-family HTH domain
MHTSELAKTSANGARRAGFTQEKLAEKADLHPVYISQVERADRAITIDSLLKITKALSIRLRDVVDDL